MRISVQLRENAHYAIAIVATTLLVMAPIARVPGA
jgi:hypothetical protein